MRKEWGGGSARPPWVREIAHELTWPSRYMEAETPPPTPRPGDIVLKPYFDARSLKQVFRVETWKTHALLDGPFSRVRQALDAALEVGVTARLAVWIDYSDDPNVHDLEDLPVYFADDTGGSEEPL